MSDLVTPLGLDAARLHLSWRGAAIGRNWKQSAYQIIVSTGAAAAASEVRAESRDLGIVCRRRRRRGHPLRAKIAR